MPTVDTGQAGLNNYQDRASNTSTQRANQLGTWALATTKGTITLPGGASFAPSNDALIIGGIVVAGGIWYYYRRKIAGTVKRVENAA
jgi:hypothetical protein